MITLSIGMIVLIIVVSVLTSMLAMLFFIWLDGRKW